MTPRDRTAVGRSRPDGAAVRASAPLEQEVTNQDGELVDEYGRRSAESGPEDDIQRTGTVPLG